MRFLKPSLKKIIFSIILGLFIYVLLTLNDTQIVSNLVGHNCPDGKIYYYQECLTSQEIEKQKIFREIVFFGKIIAAFAISYTFVCFMKRNLTSFLPTS